MKEEGLWDRLPPSGVWVWVRLTTVEIDERGRITIPSELRRRLRSTRVRVEAAGDDTLVIMPDLDADAVLKRIRDLRLSGDKRRSRYDASIAKDVYGGVKD